MGDIQERARRIIEDLVDEQWTDEEIAEISLELYDLSGVDLSEGAPDDEVIH